MDLAGLYYVIKFYIFKCFYKTKFKKRTTISDEQTDKHTDKHITYYVDGWSNPN